MKETILIADPNTEVSDVLSQYLQQDNFLVQCVQDGEMALKKGLNHPFDAIILDSVLPKLNGFEVIQAIRKHRNTPILVLSSRSEDIDCLVGLELGADDYMTKPCRTQEVIARLRALLRRSHKEPILRPTLKHDTIEVDCSKRLVTVSGIELELTNAEFNILEILMRSPGQAFSKEELTEYALGRKYTAYDRSIDVHVSNLRHKLGNMPTGEPWLKTVRGFGYVFEAQSI